MRGHNCDNNNHIYIFIYCALSSQRSNCPYAELLLHGDYNSVSYVLFLMNKNINKNDEVAQRMYNCTLCLDWIVTVFKSIHSV